MTLTLAEPRASSRLSGPRSRKAVTLYKKYDGYTLARFEPFRPIARMDQAALPYKSDTLRITVLSWDRHVGAADIKDIPAVSLCESYL